MNTTTSFLLLLILVCNGCLQKKFFDEYKNLSSENCSLVVIQKADTITKNIFIKNKKGIQFFIDEINYSKISGPWKGAAWGNIRFIYPDTTITLHTIGEAFCSPQKGNFYFISKKIIHYWK